MGTSTNTGGQREPSAERKRRRKKSAKNRPASSTSADAKQTIAKDSDRPATPKLVGTGKDCEADLRRRRTKRTGPPYSLGPQPPFQADPGGKEPDAIKIESTACLVHGIQPRYLAEALERGEFSSAYRREGPNGNYSRDSDKRGGGASAVYTRAVGTRQKWRASGYGVGGASKTKIQAVMSPAILEDKDHTWRASGLDGGGKLPGVTDEDLKASTDKNNENKNEIDEQKTWSAWTHQRERSRNTAFNATVGQSEPVVQNEQTHYQRLPIANTLKAVVCSDAATFNELKTQGLLMKVDGARGVVVMDGREVPVLLVKPDDDLVSTLKREGIADANGRVR